VDPYHKVYDEAYDGTPRFCMTTTVNRPLVFPASGTTACEVWTRNALVERVRLWALMALMASDWSEWRSVVFSVRVGEVLPSAMYHSSPVAPKCG